MIKSGTENCPQFKKKINYPAASRLSDNSRGSGGKIDIKKSGGKRISGIYPVEQRPSMAVAPKH